MSRWWQWITLCLWRGHVWMPDAFPTDWRAEAGNMRVQPLGENELALGPAG